MFLNSRNPTELLVNFSQISESWNFIFSCEWLMDCPVCRTWRAGCIGWRRTTRSCAARWPCSRSVSSSGCGFKSNSDPDPRGNWMDPVAFCIRSFAVGTNLETFVQGCGSAFILLRIRIQQFFWMRIQVQVQLDQIWRKKIMKSFLKL